MSLKHFFVLSALSLTVSGVAAHADTAFSFTLNSGNYPAITATTPDQFTFFTDDGYYHTPVIPQQIGDDSIESQILFTPTSLDFASKDADLSLSTPIFDGTSFLDGTYSALLANDYPSQLSGIPEGPSLAGTLVISTVTPEPSSLLLLGTGTLGFAAMLRRRLA